MAKRQRRERWAIWKIVLVLIGFVVGAAALFVGAHFVAKMNESGKPVSDASAALNSTVSNIMRLFGAVCVVMTAVCIGWLVVRYQQSIPAWKKRAKLPAHRRK